MVASTPVDATSRKMPRKVAPNQLSFDLATPLPREIKLMSVDEIYARLESITPVDAKEDRRIERKPAGVSARALGDYFSIFSNTPPEGGIILIGVEDDGSVT